MNYTLFFISLRTGVVRNTIHFSLQDARESARQLIQQEKSSLEDGRLPSMSELKKQLAKHGDYTGYLLNGTWFYIQEKKVFDAVKSGSK